MSKKANSLTSGALVMIGMRWTDRFIGLASTLILARLLVPDDFGIVAMASVVVSFADAMFDLGVNVSIIQRKNPTQAFYDSAWTMRILQASCVTGVLLILSPFVADYYDDSRVTAVVQIMALSILVSAFENIGLLTFQKELRFIDDAKAILFKRLAMFVMVIGLTFLLKNYWGMILGALAGRIASLIRSYLVHPMRPRFSLAEFKAIFSVSQWMLIRNVSIYIDSKMHIFLVGGNTTTSITGGYTLASEISDIPATDLLAPINRVLYPAFAKVKDDTRELIGLFLRAQAIQLLLVFPTCIGFALTATEFVPVALGEKWLFIIPFVQILALTGILSTIGTSANYVLTVLGHLRLIAMASWVQIGLFSIGIAILWNDLSPLHIAQVRMAAILLSFSLSYVILMKNAPELTVWLLVRGAVRPGLACVFMALAVWLVGWFAALPIWVLLLLKVIVGGVVYCSVVLGLWALAGKPDGPESFFIGMLRRRRAAPAQ